MHVLPADAARAVSEVAGHAMAGFGDATQFLDVQMQHVTGSQVFIALNRLTWFQIAQAAELEPAQNTADRGPAEACLLRNAQSGPALPTQCLHQLDLLGPALPVQTMWPTSP